MATKPKKEVLPNDVEWPFGRKNYIVFGIALIVIIIGYFALSQDDITFAPILLVIGYCVLIPIAIMIRSKPKTASEPLEPVSDKEPS